MAGKAHPVLERRMLDTPAGLDGRFVVAHDAELSSALNGFERFRRGRRVMARVTAPRSDRIMDARFKELWLR